MLSDEKRAALIQMCHDAGVMVLLDSKFGRSEYTSVQSSWPALEKLATAVAEAAVKDAVGGENRKSCELCDCTGDIHDQTGEWRGECPYCRPQASAVVPEETHRVIKLLVECARMAFFALDDSEERVGDDGREHVVDANNFDALCNALDALEELPDHDDETVILTGPLKAEYLLRKLLTASQPETKS